MDDKERIAQLGRLLYPAVIHILAARQSNSDGWQLLDLCGELKAVQVNRKGMLADNGIMLLQHYKETVSEWMKRQPPLSPMEVASAETLACNVGLCKDNAFLYMQGHCVYDIILRIGTAVSPALHHFESEVMDNSLLLCGYPEIDAVLSDVRTVF